MFRIRLTAMALVLGAALASPSHAASTATLQAGAGTGGTNEGQPCIDSESGTGPVSVSISCRFDFGETSARGFATFGHVGAQAAFRSFTGQTLTLQQLGRGFFDDEVVFSSIDPLAQSASVAFNMALTGRFIRQGFGNADVGASVVIRGSVFDFAMTHTGSIAPFSNFNLISGTLAPDNVDAVLRTGFVNVALNVPTTLRLRLQTNAFAGPLGYAEADFGNSLTPQRGAGNAFVLPDGITANAGTWLVNNRFVDPLAAVPEPASWALMIFGFGAVGSAARRRRGLALPNARHTVSARIL